jgi:hypothetical protein
MTFDKAIERIFEGNCILFTGSGFSFGAKNVSGSDSNIKSAPDLAKLLYEASGYSSSDTNLKKASTVYLRKKSKHDLIDLLKKIFTISHISSDQKYIGKFKWSRIYTTNYDSIIEMAYSQNRTGEYLTPVTLSDHPKDFRDKNKIAIHLNGYIDKLTPDTIHTEFRLTNRSYLAEDFISSKWIEIFRGDIKACDAIFFIGFSLDHDLDIARIIQDGDIKDKAYFIVWDKEDEINIETLQEFGDVQSISLNGFVQKIKDIEAHYKPILHKIFEPLCFSQPSLKTDLPVIRDSDFYDLLLKGCLNDHLLYHSLIDPSKYKYFSLREGLEKVFEWVKDEEKNILIESNLGNGKTLFLRALSILLVKDGYKVFYYEKYRTSINRELQKICDEYNDAIVIFDDYSTVKDYVHFFSSRRKNQILITSERITLHEVIGDEIENVIGVYKTLSIDTLTSEELSIFDNYLSKYALWKEFTTTDSVKRIDYMKTSCKSQICNIILSRIRSNNLSDKIQEVINTIRKKKEFYNALIVILISESFRFKLELGELIEILGNSALNNPSFKNNTNIKEFVDFEKNKILFKSSILSHYILGNLLQPELVIDTLILIARDLDNKYDVHPPSKEKLISIINFKTIQKAINVKDSSWKREIFRFYEEVKELSFCEYNIHFWLQYAIARLSDYNYEIAEAYFKKCYDLANSYNGYDTYKIDNHYCRFILENEIENGNITTCMDAFDYAHSILINTRKGNEKKHYPFRVAGHYKRFYEKFFKSLEPHHQKKFLTACDEMHEKCQKYLQIPEISNKRTVQETKKHLEEILLQH